MVLTLECVFIVKQYYNSHLLKRVWKDFIQVFLNSVSPPNHATLNLIQNFENGHTYDNLQCSGRLYAVTSEKREAMVKNVTERPIT